LSINWRDVRMSRALQAPLSRAAGGWGRCDETVFADARDPDYRRLLAALGELGRALEQRPRADLASVQGTGVEVQKVELPPPPPRRPPAEEKLPDGDWVYLSDLRWSAARSGWTPNGDGLPRLDRDVSNQPLRLGLRRYRKGIGTHAPSEIAYRLDGEYLRFAATAGAAETGGTVVFRLLGDDKVLYESGVMHGQREVNRVDVSLAGVRELRLVVTDAGNGHICDMANWAGARLLKAPR
jgi:hypothetical protein